MLDASVLCPFKLILIKYYIDFQKIDHTGMISDKQRRKSWIKLPILISILTGSNKNLFNHMIITYALTKFPNKIVFVRNWKRTFFFFGKKVCSGGQ